MRLPPCPRSRHGAPALPHKTIHLPAHHALRFCARLPRPKCHSSSSSSCSLTRPSRLTPAAPSPGPSRRLGPCSPSPVPASPRHHSLDAASGLTFRGRLVAESGGGQSTTREDQPQQQQEEEQKEEWRGPLPAPSTLPGAKPAIGPGNYEYLPFKVPFKMIMGTAPLDPHDWIQIDCFYEEEMAMRKHILAHRRDAVLGSLDGPKVEDAKQELLETLIDFLPQRFPHLFQRTKSGIHSVATGASFQPHHSTQDPLEACALLVQEDLCLMLPREDSGGEYVFVAGAVLFPNKWDLQEKLGQSTAAIHEPVPLYREHVSRRVDAFMAKLSPDRPFWRANWAITDDPTLFRPVNESQYAVEMEAREKAAHSPSGEELSVANAGQRLFTRSERETFVRLPRSNAVLFTIRTFVKPLSVFEGRLELAAEAVRALDDLPPSVVKYKMLGPIKGVARAFLVRCSQGLLA